jgi:hypothetical protein
VWNVYPGLPNWRTTSQIVGEKVFDNSNTFETITIFPNPTSDVFGIATATEKEILKVQIYDVTGKTVYANNSVKSSEDQIDVSKLPSGVYIVEIKNQANSVLRKKLVKAD